MYRAVRNHRIEIIHGKKLARLDDIAIKQQGNKVTQTKTGNDVQDIRQQLHDVVESLRQDAIDRIALSASNKSTVHLGDGGYRSLVHFAARHLNIAHNTTRERARRQRRGVCRTNIKEVFNQAIKAQLAKRENLEKSAQHAADNDAQNTKQPADKRLVNTHFGGMVFHRHLFKRDVAYGCLRRHRKGVPLVNLVGDSAEKTDTRIFAHIELGIRLHHNHIGDDRVGHRGNIDNARAVLLDAFPEAARRIGRITLCAEHGAREHKGLPIAAGAQINITEDDVIGVDGVSCSAVFDVHIRVDFARFLIDAATSNGLERAAVGFIDFSKGKVLLAVLQRKKIGIAAIEHDWLAVFVFIDLPAFKSMINGLVNGRIHSFA